MSAPGCLHAAVLRSSHAHARLAAIRTEGAGACPGVAAVFGPFQVPHARFEGTSVVTNKTPHAPYRGAGRPEAVFVMDRMVDRLARTVGIDPAEARRRNFIRSDEMPCDIGTALPGQQYICL